MTMCPGCFEELHNSLLAAGSQKKPVNLAAGIAGALAGSLIGVILWVVIYRLGYVAGIIGFVMSVCCIKGFEKLGGGLNRPGLWLSLFLAVLMLLVGEFAALAMDLHSALTGFGYEISYLECLQALPGIVNGEILAGAARDLVMGYVFMAIASISFIQQVNRSIHVENEALRLA